MSSSESAQPIFRQAAGHHLAEINVTTAIAAGTVPTLEEGVARLEKLRRDGPTADAFGWDQLPA